MQCFFYERGNQRVSYTAQALLGIFSLTILVTLVLAFVEKMVWLDFLYTISYIKLAITLLKYVPQAILNYRRRSTVGWSIGNILLDFTGGMLSMLQMILNAYNYGKKQYNFNSKENSRVEKITSIFLCVFRWLDINLWWSNQIWIRTIFCCFWYSFYYTTLRFI